MIRRIIVSGILGGVVLVLWAFVANVGFGVQPRINMNRIPDEARVYQVLKESVTEPGGYVVNPPITAEGRFAPGEPVFAVRNSGFGHEAAGRTMLWQIALGIIASMIAAWLLSVFSGGAGPTYSRRALFFVALGLLIAVFSELPKLDIGGYPLSAVLLLAGDVLVSWTLVGLVIAWWMGRAPSGGTTT